MKEEISLDDFTIYVMYCQDMNDLNFDTMTMERYIRLFNAGKFVDGARTGSKDKFQKDKMHTNSSVGHFAPLSMD